MDKHIATLLKTNNRVIIPGFGALITREGGEKLTFNELLKFDDGLLSDFVSKAEGTDKKATEASIKKYVEKVSASLKKGAAVKLSSIGTFIVDEKGKIQFEQGLNPKDVSNPTAKETNAEPAKPVSPPPPPPVSSESKPKDAVKTFAPATKKEEHEKEVPKKEEPKEETPKPAATPTPPTIKTTTTPESSFKKTAAVDRPEAKKTTTRKTPPPRTKSPREKRSNGDKEKKGWVVWVIILAILIGVCTASWFIFTDEIKGFISANAGKSKTGPEPPMVIADSSSIETNTINEPDITKEVEGEVIEDKDIVPLDPYAKTGQYYVVAGCFRYERNADRYVNQLKGKGYNASKFGKRKGLYVVCFEIYPSKSEALRKMREVRNTIEPEAWVLKY